jgi:hypothetical protein
MNSFPRVQARSLTSSCYSTSCSGCCSAPGARSSSGRSRSWSFSSKTETSRGEEEVSVHLPFQVETEQEPNQSSRGTLPDHLLREVETHRPEASCCPSCGGTLREFGEDVSEVLEYVPESLRSFAMCDRSSAVAAVRQWSKRLHPPVLSRVPMPDPVCSPMCWSRSTAITRRSTGSPRSMPAMELILIAPHLLAGWALHLPCSRPWSKRFASMCSRPPDSCRR